LRVQNWCEVQPVDCRNAEDHRPNKNPAQPHPRHAVDFIRTASRFNFELVTRSGVRRERSIFKEWLQSMPFAGEDDLGDLIDGDIRKRQPSAGCHTGSCGHCR
jgi:hypothetical protein